MLEWKIIAVLELQNCHQASKLRHSINGLPCDAFTRLKIATAGQETGFYLLHQCFDSREIDTWHITLKEALEQAEFEFGIR
jgi:hypothetical protein